MVVFFKKIPARTLILLAFGLLWNAFLFLSCYTYGIGLSADSANYVSAAENLAHGNGLIQFDGYKFLNAPPLFVWILIPNFFIGSDPFLWAFVLNLICMNLSFFLVITLAKKALGESYSLLGLAFCLTGYWAFTHAFQMLLSESIFIALLLLFVVKLDEDIKSQNQMLWSSIFLAALCATRYAGLMMIPGLLTFLIIQKVSMKRIMFFISPTAIATTLWGIRNYLVSGSLLGGHELERKLNFTAIFHNISNLDWRLKLVFAVVSVAIISALWFRQTWSNVFKICLLMAGSYWLLLMLQSGINMNQMPRYLSIIEFLVSLVLLELLRFIIPQMLYQNIFWGILLMVKLVFMGEKVRANMINGAGGFHSSKWQNTEMIMKLQNIGGFPYLSNYPDHIYWIKHEPCMYFRFKDESESSFLSRVPKEGKIIWFRMAGREAVIQDIESVGQAYSQAQIDSCEWYYLLNFTASLPSKPSSFYK